MNWTKEEVLATIDAYFEMLELQKRGASFEKKARNHALLPLLQDRTYKAIEYKHQNISAVLDELDCEYLQGYRPAKNYQRLLKELVLARLKQQIDLDQGKTYTAQIDALREATSIDVTDSGRLVLREPSVAYGINMPNETERTGLVRTRVGHGAYRRRLLDRWDHRCAVTGFSYEGLLIASHIVGWKDSTDFERLDVANGILLSPTYDALFDKHLIGFENDGCIIVSKQIQEYPFHDLGVTGEERINDFTPDNFKYLERHRDKVQWK